MDYLNRSTKILGVFLALVMQAVPVRAISGGPKPQVRTEMLVSAAWLADHLKDPDLVVLCVASNADSYAKGHIPGARLIKLSDITVTRDEIPNELPSIEQLEKVFTSAGVTNSSRIILYGERYNLLAARAYYTLDYMGLADRASLLDGGIEKWRAERRQETADLPKVETGKLTSRPNKKIVIETAAMRDLSRNRMLTSSLPLALIDARPAEEYTGQKYSEDVHKAGHIPGSTHLYWMDNLVSRENPVLRPIEELRAIYLKAGVSAGTEVVTYCRTGMQSSYDYFVAKYLGYNVKMYDASFIEWSWEELPVESSVKP